MITESVPEFIDLKSGQTKSIRLHTFKSANGNWTVVAECKPSKAVHDNAETEIKLSVAGKSVVENKLFLLPVGGGQPDIKLVASIPSGFLFSNARVVSTSQTLTKRTLEPALVPDPIDSNRRLCLLRVPLNDILGLDISQLDFKLATPNVWSRITPYGLAAYIFGYTCLMIWINHIHWRRVQLRMNFQAVLEDFTKLYGRLLNARHTAGQFIPENTNTVHRSLEYSVNVMKTSFFSYGNFRDEISRLDRVIHDLILEIDRLKSEAPAHQESDIYQLRCDAQSLIQRVHELEKNRRPLLFSAPFGSLIAGILIILAMPAGSWASKDSLAAPKNELLLGEFSVSVKDDAKDDVTVSVGFIPLKKNAKRGQSDVVSIATNRGSPVMFKTVVSVQPDSVRVVPYPKLLRIRAPVSNLYEESLVERIGYPLVNVGFGAPYQRSIGSSNDGITSIECKLSDAVSIQRNYFGFIHPFPFDRRQVDVPLESAQTLAISNVSIAKLADWTAKVKIEGIKAGPKEAYDRYVIPDVLPSTPTILARPAALRITANFERPAFQQIFLTVGQFILAVALGIIVGYVATIPDSQTGGKVMQGLGLVAVPAVFRAVVYSTYEELPTVLAGQSPTVFELCFFTSWVIYVLCAWGTWRVRKDRY